MHIVNTTRQQSGFNKAFCDSLQILLFPPELPFSFNFLPLYILTTFNFPPNFHCAQHLVTYHSWPTPLLSFNITLLLLPTAVVTATPHLSAQPMFLVLSPHPFLITCHITLLLEDITTQLQQHLLPQIMICHGKLRFLGKLSQIGGFKIVIWVQF